MTIGCAFDDVPQQEATRDNLALYRKKRDALVDTAAQQAEMARWCRKHNLPDESRIHWSKVLSFEPQNREALDALGLKWHEGRMLTRDQIAAERERAGERLRAMRHWQPLAVKWRGAIESNNPKRLDEALRALDELKDPDALPALEAVFAGNAASDVNDRLNQLLITVADRMSVPEATAVLLRRAVVADAASVRLAACEALKKRPMHTYVPELLAAMPGRIKTKFNVFTLPDGSVTHEHEVQLEGPDGIVSMTYESMALPTNLAIAAAVTPAELANERNKAVAIERRAAAAEARNRAVRERLEFVLRSTTGFTSADDPELWAKQYAEYYGWEQNKRARPEYRSHTTDFRPYYPVPQVKTNRNAERSPRPATNASPRPAASASPRPAGSLVPTANWSRRFQGECFAAGTSVMTMTGPAAIETIRPGDRVLAQDLRTGELAYQAVQDRTVRRGMKLVRLQLGTETVNATFGHPFWIVGRGWEVAGHLEVGDRLRGLEQDVTVEAIDELPPQIVYNLVVNDFATYFVGTGRLLVHDDTALVASPVVVPGLVAQAETP